MKESEGRCPFCHETHLLKTYQGAEGCALCLAALAADWRQMCESVEYGHALPDRLRAIRGNAPVEEVAP